MATYVLLPGAGSDSWYWHLVEPELRRRGHEVIAVDLTCDDDSAGLAEYADVVVEAVGDRRDLVLVAQSMAELTAPIVAARIPVRLIVLVAAMVPAPGESAGDWWENTGQAAAQREQAERDGFGPEDDDDPMALFLHDVPRALATEAMARARRQSGTQFEKPWPLDAWPDVPTRSLLCRDDRQFPAAFQRRVVRERLDIAPDEMDGGHLPGLARPLELAARLHEYVVELEGPADGPGTGR